MKNKRVLNPLDILCGAAMLQERTDEELKKKQRLADAATKPVAKKFIPPTARQNSNLTKPEKVEKGLKPVLRHIVTELLELCGPEIATVFYEPLEEQGNPEYYQAVETPISFKQIKENIESEKYMYAKQFHADVSLLLRNCSLFIDGRSRFGKAGRAMQKRLDERWSSLLLAKSTPAAKDAFKIRRRKFVTVPCDDDEEGQGVATKAVQAVPKLVTITQARQQQQQQPPTWSPVSPAPIPLSPLEEGQIPGEFLTETMLKAAERAANPNVVELPPPQPAAAGNVSPAKRGRLGFNTVGSSSAVFVKPAARKLTFNDK